MKRRYITELYNTLAKTTTEGLEDGKVSTMLVSVTKMRRIAEDSDALIKGIDDKCPKEIKDLTEIPKGEDERARIMIAQNKWREQKSAAEQKIMDEEIEFDTKFLEQEESLKYIAKQSDLKISEKAVLLEWLSK